MNFDNTNLIATNDAKNKFIGIMWLTHLCMSTSEVIFFLIPTVFVGCGVTSDDGFCWLGDINNPTNMSMIHYIAFLWIIFVLFVDYLIITSCFDALETFCQNTFAYSFPKEIHGLSFGEKKYWLSFNRYTIIHSMATVKALTNITLVPFAYVFAINRMCWAPVVGFCGITEFTILMATSLGINTILTIAFTLIAKKTFAQIDFLNINNNPE